MINEKIIKEFENLIKQIQYDIDKSRSKEDKQKNMFRLQNIKKALKIIKDYKKEIKKGEELKDIKGIGKGTITRINEILDDGKLKEIKDDVKDDKYFGYINELEKVYGIGRKLALELFEKYNVKSIKELKQLYNKKKIDLPPNVIKGLKYYDTLKMNIPREETDNIYNILIKYLNDIDKNLFGTICGSYRRLKETSNDIDFLIIHPKIVSQDDLKKNKYFEKYLKLLIKNKLIVETLTGTDVKSKFMGLFQLDDNSDVRRIDIRFIPYESYYFALLYFTGSGVFNRRMRQIAIDNGYILNEYGLYDENNKNILVKSEKEIFDILNMEYLQPQLRDEK